MVEGQLSVQCDCSPVVDSQFSAVTTPTAVEALIEAVATAADTDPSDLPPLFETIDLEAVERLFANGQSGGPSGTTLCFTVLDWHVFVRDDGRIRVCEPDGRPTPAAVFE